MSTGRARWQNQQTCLNFRADTTFACDKVTAPTPAQFRHESLGFARQNARSAGARTALAIGVDLDYIAVINVLVHSLIFKGV